MFNLFPKKPKIKLGKASQEAAAAEKKQRSPLAGVAGTWKKLNSMDRKQAYTFGAIGLVALVGLMMLGSAAGSNQEDFSDFETRGYDLANMPFSSDEAEQYLLASKYPDMQGTEGGLYTATDKAERQAEDMEEEEIESDSSYENSDSNYTPGRYYGAGSGRGGGRTAVGQLNSANLKSANGSGMSGTFGPSGDFSNFRSQNKGSDRFTPTKGLGSGNARKALQQAAIGSRAAAGLKDNRLANAKKAMMGGNIQGSKAFLDDSGAVDLKEAKGLNLDTNAPVSSADLSGLDKGLDKANKEAAKKEKQKEEKEWWQEMLIDVAKQLVQGAINMGLNSVQSAIQEAKAGRVAAQEATAEVASHANAEAIAHYNLEVKEGTKLSEMDLSSKDVLKAAGVKETKDGVLVDKKTGTELGSKGTDGKYSLNEAGEKYSLSAKQANKVVEIGRKNYVDNNQDARDYVANAKRNAKQQASNNYVPQNHGSSSDGSKMIRGTKTYPVPGHSGYFQDTDGNYYDGTTGNSVDREKIFTKGN